MLWRLASAWGDSPPRNSCTTWRLNSIECVRCLAMGFLLESPVQLADSQGPYLSTSKGALQARPGRGGPICRSAPTRCIAGRWSCCLSHEFVRREIIEARMRTHFVVVAAPCLNDDLRLGARTKPFET